MSSAIAEEIRAAVRAEVAPLRAELEQLRRALADRGEPDTLDSAGACRALGYIRDGAPNLPALNALLTRHADLRRLAKKRGRRLVFSRLELMDWIATHRPASAGPERRAR